MSIKQDQIQKLLDLLRSIDESLKIIASTVRDSTNEPDTKVLSVDVLNQVSTWIDGGEVEIDE